MLMGFIGSSRHSSGRGLPSGMRPPRDAEARVALGSRAGEAHEAGSGCATYVAFGRLQHRYRVSWGMAACNGMVVLGRCVFAPTDQSFMTRTTPVACHWAMGFLRRRERGGVGLSVETASCMLRDPISGHSIKGGAGFEGAQWAASRCTWPWVAQLYLSCLQPPVRTGLLGVWCIRRPPVPWPKTRTHVQRSLIFRLHGWSKASRPQTSTLRASLPRRTPKCSWGGGSHETFAESLAVLNRDRGRVSGGRHVDLK